jgi:site-specific recombinase XerD
MRKAQTSGIRDATQLSERSYWHQTARAAENAGRSANEGAAPQWRPVFLTSIRGQKRCVSMLEKRGHVRSYCRPAPQNYSALTERRGPDEFLFVRSDGRRWKKSDQTRPVKDALKKAGLATDGSIYALRHTYVSRAIEGGVPLNVIAENCGTVYA